MKTLILAVLLSIAGVYSTHAEQVATIQHISWPDSGYCTTFSINAELGYWMTAGHCFQAGVEATIGGEPAVAQFADDRIEVAVYKTRLKAPAVRLAPRAPRVCNHACGPRAMVTIVGFPISMPLTVAHGYLANRGAKPWAEGDVFDTYDAPAEPGNSGSPIFNAEGELIGILVGGSNRGFTYGTPWEALQKFRHFWSAGILFPNK